MICRCVGVGVAEQSSVGWLNPTTVLQTFFYDMGLPMLTPTIHGENNETIPGGESSLDIQCVLW
jgi:hypothetical protein